MSSKRIYTADDLWELSHLPENDGRRFELVRGALVEKPSPEGNPMTTQERIYTFDDLWELSHLPENCGRRFELVKGALIEMSPSGGKHGGIASFLDRRIGTFVETNQLGYTTTAEAGYILFSEAAEGGTLRVPDVGFVAAAHLPDGLPDGYIPLAPDLAVEVVSPHDKAPEIEDKISDYLRAGVRMSVFAYPKTKTLMVYTPTAVLRLTVDDTLDGGDVLPGFTLPVRDIFPA